MHATPTRPLRELAAVIGILLLATLLAAPANARAAAAKPRIERFAVTVSGTQKTTWSLDATTYDGCVAGDVRQSGSGVDEFSFTGSPGSKLLAMKMGKRVVLLTQGRTGSLGLPATGTATRQGSITMTQLSGGESHCGGSDSPSAPPAPDCGARPFKATFDLRRFTPAEYPTGDDLLTPLVPVLAVQGPTMAGDTRIDDLYKNCPGATTALLATPNSDLTDARLFSKSRRLVIRGTATETYTSGGFTKTTSLAWRAVLVRQRAAGAGGTPTKPGARPGAAQCSNGRDDDGDGLVDFPADTGCSSRADATER